MNLNQWAIRWGIPFEAVEDLRREMGTLNIPRSPLNPRGDKSEAAVQVEVRLEASRLGVHMMRNNVGVMHTDDGTFVRYGLMNESKQMNQKVKSSDLIGIRPIRIEPRHVGSVIGQFVARETKPEYWAFVGNDHETGQLAFLELVLSLGGDAAFANKEGTL